MKEIIYKSALSLHVLAGILALLFGLIAMNTRKKGGKLHNRSGLIFYWSMCFIFVTTILFFILYPAEVKYHFFLTIGIVSFYPTFSGKRILSMKKGVKALWFDWLALILIFISGMTMLAYGYYLLSLKTGQFYDKIFFAFGFFSLVQAYGDWRLFSRKLKPKKMHWLFSHAAKMIGAYAAAVTAFCVNIVPRFLPVNTPNFVYILTWVGPTAIFLFITKYYVRKYKVQFKAA